MSRRIAHWNHRTIVALAFFMLVAVPVSSRAGLVLLTDLDSMDTRSDSGYTFGYRFKTGATGYNVGYLGVPDLGAPGLAGTIKVGLWSDAGTLLTSVNITGTGDFSAAGYIFKATNGVSLAANTDYCLGLQTLNGDLVFNNTPYANSPTMDPALGSFDGCRFAGGWNFPSTTGSGFLYGGPNLMIPEPASFSLLALGGLALIRRRRG